MKDFLVAAFLSATLISVASAHDYTVGTLEIGHPWTRPSSAKIAGGFLTITNKGPQAERFIGGSLEAAEKIELHETTMEGNVAKMRPVAGGIEIKPGETVELKPGSFHVMFVGLNRPLKSGERIKGTLIFEKAGTVAVEYAVESQAPTSQQSGHHGH
jgi:periplasmic copper chaperone A